MIAASRQRFMTALLVSAICVYTMSQALPTLRFGLVETMAARGGASAALAPLIDAPTVSVLARELRLDDAPPADSRRHVAELSELLTLAPLSGLHWLELARARYAAEEPPERIFSALAMSQVTGPNEATIMAARAVFGLALWSLAPEPARKALLRDLTGGWPQVTETRRMLLRVMLAEAAPQTREELTRALTASGVEGVEIASRLGLDASPAP